MNHVRSRPPISAKRRKIRDSGAFRTSFQLYEHHFARGRVLTMKAGGRGRMIKVTAAGVAPDPDAYMSPMVRQAWDKKKAAQAAADDVEPPQPACTTRCCLYFLFIHMYTASVSSASVPITVFLL